MAAPPFSPLKTRAVIRPATLSDKAFVVALSGRVFSIYGPYKATIRQWFESAETLTLISAVQGWRAGFAMVGALPGEQEGEATRAEILAIAVVPELQRQGIGRDLLQSAHRKAADLGEQRIFLHTAGENLAAQKLFFRNGYRPVETKKGFYPSGQDAIMMVKQF